MSDARDSGPLAPRRPLGKSPTTDVPTEAMTPPQHTGNSAKPTPASGPAPPPYQSRPSAPAYPWQQAALASTQAPAGAPASRPPEQQGQRPDSATPPGASARQGSGTSARTKPLTEPSTDPATGHTWSGRRPDTAVAALAPAEAGERAAERGGNGSRDRKRERAERRAAASRPRTVRRARLKLMRVDPWSVTKVAFLLSIAFGIMCVVAVFLVFSILSAAGLWDHVNETVQGVLNQDAKDAFDIKDYVGMSRVMGLTTLIAVVDVVLITALATLGAFLYNMAASLLGGVEVTLAEDVR